MADRVTRCPHCSTSFRITDAQLQTAKGAVRCGSCLQIFRALDYLQPLPGQARPPATDNAAAQADATVAAPSSPEPKPVAPEPETTASQAAPQYPASEFEDDDALISDDMDHEEGTSRIHLGDLNPEFAQQSRPSAHQRGSLFDRELKLDEDRETDHTDESWAMALLHEEGDDTAQEADSLPPEEADSEPANYGFDVTDDYLDDDDEPLNLSIELGSHRLTEDFDSPLPSTPTADDDESQANVTSSPEEESASANFEPEHDNRDSAQPPLFSVTGERALKEAPGIEPERFDDLLDSRREPRELLDIEPASLAADDKSGETAAPADDGATAHRAHEHEYTPERDDTADAAPDSGEAFDHDSGDNHDYPREDKYDLDNDYHIDREYDLDKDYDLEHEYDENDPHHLLLQGIAQAPVEMEWHQEPSPWPRRLLWGGLSLIACLALVAQLAWFKFDEYSRQQPWRQAYASLCPLLGCQLPSLEDPARVKAYNLVVRSHPRTDNALIIDSILLNTAPFEQPFPDFALSFSNLQGKPVAYRRFNPREYLGGEMAGATSMPSGQPVHISLEILDPGDDAVNYTAVIPLD